MQLSISRRVRNSESAYYDTAKYEHDYCSFALNLAAVTYGKVQERDRRLVVYDMGILKPSPGK